MSFQHRCRACGGDGFYGAMPHDTCAVCNGKGNIHLNGAPSDYSPCKSCGGDGYFGFDHHSTCADCRGLGIVIRP